MQMYQLSLRIAICQGNSSIFNEMYSLSSPASMRSIIETSVVLRIFRIWPDSWRLFPCRYAIALSFHSSIAVANESALSLNDFSIALIKYI